MGHQPERTCIGCRSVFAKDAVIRIVSGPTGIVIDYREKLPGRAAYVCPTQDCITKALTKDLLAKALRIKGALPSRDEFLTRLRLAIEEKIRSLIVMSGKAGKLLAGYSAVHDGLEKERINMLLFAQDLSDGTKEKVLHSTVRQVKQATLFTCTEIGGLLNRELVGVVGINDKGLANAVWKETERLKGLINSSE